MHVARRKSVYFPGAFVDLDEDSGHDLSDMGHPRFGGVTSVTFPNAITLCVSCTGKFGNPFRLSRRHEYTTGV